jgi:hypothetical protein
MSDRTAATVPRFFLGAHQPGWLRDDRAAPLFVSDRQLRGYRRLPRAGTVWALDSGAFTTLARGEVFDPPATYASRVRRYRDEIGHLAWAAPQDWMCEPFILAATGLSVAEHQRRTVANYVALRDAAPDLPIIPVVQGWTPADYLRCVDLYAAPTSRGGADLDLSTVDLAGLGSVCRRQGTGTAEHIITALHGHGVTRLHGFGIKVLGLRRFGHLLTSADSMAWSYAARRAAAPLRDCAGHINCANCRRYAYAWHATTAAAFTAAHTAPRQAHLFALPGAGETTTRPGECA